MSLSLHVACCVLFSWNATRGRAGIANRTRRWGARRNAHVMIQNTPPALAPPTACNGRLASQNARGSRSCLAEYMRIGHAWRIARRTAVVQHNAYWDELAYKLCGPAPTHPTPIIDPLDPSIRIQHVASHQHLCLRVSIYDHGRRKMMEWDARWAEKR